MQKIESLVGQQFGYYTVLKEVAQRKTLRYYLCRCRCGVEREIAQNSLRAGTVRSCGCWKRQQMSDYPLAQTHGMSHTVEYQTWLNMKARCYRPEATEYFRYGARGITICDAWRNSFEQFYEDMGPKPSPGHSIDRHDFNGNYEPSNCYWATAGEQANNRRTNTRITLFGRTQTLVQWERELGVKHHTVMTRMGKRGWTVERALTTPTRKWERKTPDAVHGP